MTAGFHYRNWGLCICFRLHVSMDHNGVKVNTPDSQSIIIKEYNFLFNVDIVNLLLENNGGDRRPYFVIFVG